MKMNYLKRWFFLTFLMLMFGIQISWAQDIKEVAKAPILTTNGGISFSQIGTYIPGDTIRHADPYTYYLAGNINFNMFSVVNVPLSFAYTNNQINSDAALPFNRFSIAPSYKWVKVYAGYTSMTFSPYTLAGYEILGGGVELTPDNGFKVSAVYGRLRKEVRPDSNVLEPTYRRMGGGIKVGYSSKYGDVAFNIFKAKDEINPAFYNNTDSFVTPKDNVTGSLSLDLKMIDNLRFNFEYALSAINEDISKNDSINKGFSDQIVEQHGDLSTHHAMKAGVSQTSSIGSIGATYERVDANYNTFGSYYFINDFENITANFSTSIKKRLNFDMNAGYQRDNLSGQKFNGGKRFIFSANVSSSITKRLNAGASFSNVQSYIHIKDIYNEVTATNQFQNLDTMSFSQLNMTSSGTLNYLLQNTKESRQNINASFTYQEASEKQNNQTRYTGNKIYNSVLSYQISKIPQKLNISTSVNYNHNQLPKSYMGVISYNLSVQKAFFEKLKVSFVGTYSKSFNDSLTLANILNLRISGMYTFQKRHNFNLSLAEVHNKGLRRTSTQYSVNLTYSYMFDFYIDRKDKNFKFKGNF
jgi:hypothetical protein